MIGLATCAGARIPHLPVGDNLSVLLLHFNETAPNGTVLDSSSYHRPVSSQGGLALSTSVYQFPPGSYLFNGGGRVAYADAPEFALGTNDFCVEGWYDPISSGSRQFLSGQADASGTNASVSFFVQRNANKTISAGCYSGGTLIGSINSATTLEEGAFVHVAYRRRGTEFKLFIAGVSQGTATSSASVNDSPNDMCVGRLGAFIGDSFNGYVDEFRWRVGDYVYLNDFTPTGPFRY